MEVHLVTGGAGFIGSNYIRYILSNRNDVAVIVLDYLNYSGNLNNLKEFLSDNVFVPNEHVELTEVEFSGSMIHIDRRKIQARLEMMKFKLDGYRTREFSPREVEKVLYKRRLVTVVANVMDRKTVKSLLDISDVVIHLAAETHVDRSILDPGIFLITNIYGTQNLLECGKNANMKKFIHVSTDEVYGPAENGKSFTEDHPLNPKNPYSVSKVTADELVRVYQRIYDLPAVVVRPTNNFGPYQYPEKLIPLTVIKALRDERIPIYGDGKQVRDWLHVEDMAIALELIIRKGKVGEVYNVAGRNQRENLYVVRTILEILQKPEDLITYVEDRPSHDRRYSIDDEKIRSELGFKSRSFEETIPNVVKWYVENEWWWKNILENDENFIKFMKEWYGKRLSSR